MQDKTQAKPVSSETFDELAQVSPVIAKLRAELGSEFEAEMAKPHPPTAKPRWQGGLTPAKTRRKAKGAQTHLALALQTTEEW